MTEKQASSEIAQSRERFEKLAEDAGFDVEDYDFAAEAYCDIEADAAWRGYQWAERDTRELVAQIVNEFEEGLRYTPTPEGGFKVGDLMALLRRVAERIRGKE